MHFDPIDVVMAFLLGVALSQIGDRLFSWWLNRRTKVDEYMDPCGEGCRMPRSEA